MAKERNGRWGSSIFNAFGERTQGHAEHMCGPTAVCQGKPSEIWEARVPRVRVTETKQLKPTLLWCKKAYYSHVNL